MIARTITVLLLWMAAATVCSEAAAVIHHDLQVELYPQEHRFSAQDTLTLPPDRPDTVMFRLHEGLAPRLHAPGMKIARLAPEGPYGSYRVSLPPGQNRLVLSYGGRLHHPLDAPEKEYARGLRGSPGQISPQGVYLTGDSLWYPHIEDELLTFSLRIKMPPGWQAVSQGSRTRSKDGETTWAIASSQEQIFLIAGPFTEYLGPAGQVQAMVFLRRPEAQLAQTYLTATARYIEMYETLIGSYPYDKFALVENWWESGFGMPSFTLLGPRVIRFPFILHSSYPHEILHNWWGNSVYPRYAAGNWAEGLTAYLADHLLQEQRAEGAQYRQSVLQKYTDYVSSQKDFPLIEFTGRHSSASEAVGYGKTMMFFHMLRRQIGDRMFIEALQVFYRGYRFKTADFSDLQKTFEMVAGQPLETLFAQWVRRTGAPQLTIELARVRAEGEGYVIEAVLRQRQPGPPYALDVPLVLTLAGETAARSAVVPLRDRMHKVTLSSTLPPLRLDVDPHYHLFRKLDRAEIPPALSQVFGAEQITVVLPAAAAAEQMKAYQAFAQSLAHSGPERVTAVFDRELDRLPADGSVVLLGWENRFRETARTAAAGYGASISDGQAALDGKTFPRQAHSVVFTLRHPDNAGLVVAWIAADPPAALAGLARKLPHYHKYSYLAFEGREPQNLAKGRWPVLDSPMTLFFTEARPAMGSLPQEAPLATLPAASAAGN
ncbi:MAG: M1 family peptidase [Desulfobacteraceae bacterium]|nr:MAG: M1 family peptidase [Desulfobacteraceae bacterium]